jgi:tetratricopeptide (TPR) repeat protein
MKNQKLLFTSLLTILILVTGFVQGQDLKTIKGKVTYKDQPLLNAHIVNLDSKASVKTTSEGSYQIQAKIGEELSFSYVGLKTIKVIIEDVTTTLNIKMTEKVNELKTVVVKSNKKRGKSQAIFSKKLAKIPTAFGEIDLKKVGFKTDYIQGKDLNLAAAAYNVAPAIAAKIPNVFSPDEISGLLYVSRGAKPDLVFWDIDGAVMDRAPAWLQASDIVDIYLLKNAPARYGNKSVVIVITENNPAIYAQKKKAKTEKYQNQNFYDANSVANQIDPTQNDFQINQGAEKEIYGTLTFLNKPVADVLVSVAGKKDAQVYTDQEGKYRLKVRVGDIVQYTHASYETVSIFVEDVTEELSFSLKDQISKKRGAVANRKEKMEEDYDSSRGDFDPTKSGFSQTFVDGSKISNVYPNIQEALVGKITGYLYDRIDGNSYLRNGSGSLTDFPVAWEIDGIFTSYAPPVELSQIKSVRALKSYGATNRYGTQAKGGVIIIKTIFGDFTPEGPKKNSFLEEYANSNFYSGDASLTSLEMKEQNKFAQSVIAYKNKYKAFEFYQNELKDKITNYGDHLSVAIQFLEKYNDEALATKIFNEVAVANSKNPEVLKSIAYYYQLLGNERGAIAMYERVFKLRPKHAQSFRDLSNAYVDYDLYRKAWKLYWAYMIKGKVTSEEGIGELMYNDMEWLFYCRANQMKFKRNFEPIHKNETEFKRDVRMVFEWNTSEAEFELEFVSPDRRVYTFDHSLEANGDLITKEKMLGYSSKMFVIEDLGKGDWLVNITYKGNKKTVPTFLKLTTYFNWGKPSEKRDVNVYKLDIQNQKASLLKFDSEFEVFDKIAKN